MSRHPFSQRQWLVVILLLFVPAVFCSRERGVRRRRHSADNSQHNHDKVSNSAPKRNNVHTRQYPAMMWMKLRVAEKPKLRDEPNRHHKIKTSTITKSTLAARAAQRYLNSVNSRAGNLETAARHKSSDDGYVDNLALAAEEELPTEEPKKDKEDEATAEPTEEKDPREVEEEEEDEMGDLVILDELEEEEEIIVGMTNATNSTIGTLITAEDEEDMVVGGGFGEVESDKDDKETQGPKEEDFFFGDNEDDDLPEEDGKEVKDVDEIAVEAAEEYGEGAEEEEKKGGKKDKWSYEDYEEDDEDNEEDVMDSGDFVSLASAAPGEDGKNNNDELTEDPTGEITLKPTEEPTFLSTIEPSFQPVAAPEDLPVGAPEPEAEGGKEDDKELDQEEAEDEKEDDKEVDLEDPGDEKEEDDKEVDLEEPVDLEEEDLSSNVTGTASMNMTQDSDKDSVEEVDEDIDVDEDIELDEVVVQVQEEGDVAEVGHHLLIEVLECIELGNAYVYMSAYEKNEEDCMEDPTSCNGGCCRLDDYIRCDEKNEEPQLPCICNQNTQANND